MAKHRSPAYPAINLEEAVALVHKLYPHASRHPIGVESVAELWGYKGLSSSAPYVAALKQYQLLDEKRHGSERMLQLTEEGKDIAVDPSFEAPSTLEATKIAALSPTIFNAMWDKWGSQLPPESEMRRYLERDRGFNPKNVGRVVENYKATVSYAKLDELDKIETEGGDVKSRGIREKSGKSTGSGAAGDLFNPFPNFKASSEMRELPITLPSLAIAVIKVPATMSQLDYDTLLASIQAWKPALVSQSKPAAVQTDAEDEDFTDED